MALIKNNLNKPMNGKICMVTGATSSIGEVTARELARQGATVIVVGRNPQKSAATVDKIKEQTGNPRVEFMLADLSSQQEIRRLAQQFRSKYQRLHVLVNNAGAVFTKRRESVDGIEMTFAVNHLSHFLLTNLLLDMLRADSPARIINTSALLHKFAEIDFNDLQNRKKYGGWKVYRQTKLANLLFTYELARKLEGAGVTVNALHPGVLASNLAMNNTGIVRLIKPLVSAVLTTPEDGAQTMIYLAASLEVEGVTGRYFIKKKAVPSSEASYDKDTAGRLWQVSAELTGFPASI